MMPMSSTGSSMASSSTTPRASTTSCVSGRTTTTVIAPRRPDPLRAPRAENRAPGVTGDRQLHTDSPSRPGRTWERSSLLAPRLVRPLPALRLLPSAARGACRGGLTAVRFLYRYQEVVPLSGVSPCPERAHEPPKSVRAGGVLSIRRQALHRCARGPARWRYVDPRSGCTSVRGWPRGEEALADLFLSMGSGGSPEPRAGGLCSCAAAGLYRRASTCLGGSRRREIRSAGRGRWCAGRGCAPESDGS